MIDVKGGATSKQVEANLIRLASPCQIVQLLWPTQ